MPQFEVSMSCLTGERYAVRAARAVRREGKGTPPTRNHLPYPIFVSVKNTGRGRKPYEKRV